MAMQDSLHRAAQSAANAAHQAEDGDAGKLTERDVEVLREVAELLSELEGRAENGDD